jgi:hypothetical protein
MKKQIDNIFKLINESNERLLTLTFNEINKSEDFKKVKIRINDKIEEKEIKFDTNVKSKKTGHYKTTLFGKDILLLKIKAYGNSENDPSNIFIYLKRSILKIIKNEFNTNI